MADKWTPTDEERARLDAAEPPADADWNPNAVGITYPHCRTFLTGTQCTEGLDVGTILETRCILEDGTVTHEYQCHIKKP